MTEVSKILPLYVLVLLLMMATRPQASAQTSGPVPEPGSVSVDSLLVDSFDSVSQWSTNPAAGVEITIHPDSGRHGPGIRLDFDFHGHVLHDPRTGSGGYAIIHRQVDLDLPTNYQFTFAVRGHAPTNTLEFKLVDPTGANVWWSNNPNFSFSREWRTIARKKRQICFAWGPAGGGEIHRVAAIEFAITAGSGGKGRVWIDDLALTPLEQESPFDVTAPVGSTPIVGTWVAAATPSGDRGSSLDLAADGSLSSTIGAMGNFSYSVADHRLTTTFKNARTGKSEHHTTLISIEHDTLTQKDGNGTGNDVTMKRIRPAKGGDDPIIGVWSYPVDVGTAFVAFSKNGQGRFRLPMSTCSGTWTDSGNGRLTASVNGQISETKYSIENDVLTIKSQGKEAKYNRVAAPE